MQRTASVLALLALATPAAFAATDPPTLIQYQGRLMDAASQPVTAASLPVTFALYSTSVGGTALWTETRTVDVDGGLMSVMLGEVTALPANLFDQTASLYLGVTYGTDSEAVPRYRLGSAPFALRAGSAANADDVAGANINPNSIAINGSPVVDAGGNWVGSPTGLVGPQGPIGPQGPEGPQGTAGPAGADGADGADGDDGAPGAVGPAGPQGASPFGLDGANAYYDQGSVGIGMSDPYTNFALDIENLGTGTSWSGAISAGSTSGSKVVLGDYLGNARIGGQLADHTNWAPLEINNGMVVTPFGRKDFTATNYGSNSSTIHHPSNGGGWFIRSASSSGNVILQDLGGRVGVATSAPTEGFDVNVHSLFRGGVATGPTTVGVHIGRQSGQQEGKIEIVSAAGSNALLDFKTPADGDFGARMIYYSANDELHVEGTDLFSVNVLEIRGGADIVEGFDSTEVLEPGTVVVIDPANAGELIASTDAYDRKVAGIVSGANGVNPGLHLGQDGVLDGEFPVAMSGRVWVKASAENGAIQPGDRLTTAALAGHAMKATDADLWDGAVIGKAMTAIDAETGLVLVLVNLQ